MSIKVRFIKTLWGVTKEKGNIPSGYAALFQRIKAEGFDGIETPISVIEDKKLFAEALKSSGLVYIAMINTCIFPPDPISSKPEDHLASFKRLVKEAKELNPLFINSHSGRDSWSFQVAQDFFSRVLPIEKEEGIEIYHETHRGRILYNPWVTRDLCKVFPSLKLTADLSHWCVVAERVFDPKGGLDDDWEEVLEIVSERTHHIHARVGYAQGPQVPDPSAPEYRTALTAHECWWDHIITKQSALGKKEITVEPEHGTDGYQHRLPFTNVEVADLWVVNNWIKDNEKERMSKLSYWG
jgi:sugar phosphate isomerase/epimerase